MNKKNKFKLLRTLIIMLIITQLCMTQMFESFASYDNRPENTVTNFVNNLGKDWKTVVNQFHSTLQNTYDEFLNNKSNVEKHLGLLDIKTAKLIETVEVDYNDIKSSFFNDYDVENSKFYIVGIDFDVYEENTFYFNGIWYNAVSVVREENEWKIVEFVHINDPQLIMDRSYNISDNFYQTINIRELRNEGILVNGNGETYGSLNGEIITSETNNKMLRTKAKNTKAIPTDTTMVSLGKYDNSGKFTNQVSVPFHQYCIAVTAGEVRGSEFDGAARKACIVAIKTYTWHYLLVPILPSMAINITTKMQAYRPDKVSENSNVTSNYNAIKDIWMESSEGYIFEALYKAGGYNENGLCGGELKQNGVRYLIDECGYTWQKAISYFYSNSNKSSGLITLFNKNKDVIVFK